MRVPSFLTVCLNPTLQKTLILPNLREGEVNRASAFRTDASGKGINVTRVLHQLGQKAVHLTQCGGRDGEIFLSLALQDGLTISQVPTDAEVRTCTTLLNQERGSTTEITEEGRPVDSETERAIRDRFVSLLGRSHTVVISGSKAPGFSADLFPWMVREARSRHITVIIDYRGADLRDSLRSRPTVIKPNFTEFVTTFLPGMDVREGLAQVELLEAAKEEMLTLWKDHGVTSVLTRGAWDTLFLTQGKVCSMTPPSIKPVNTIGCGDAFTAGLANALRQGEELEEAVRQAHDCAGRNAALLRPGVIR